MTLLIVYLSLALGVSFFCSLVEATLLSVTHAHIAMIKKEQPRTARILEGFKARIDRPIIAILTLNTVAHTAGAAGVGAQILKLWGNEWIAVGSGLLTFAILVFSEVIPKTLGAAYWKTFAPFAAVATRGMVVVLLPIVTLLEVISKMISSENTVERITREELLVVVEMGRAEGVLRGRESRVIKNLLRLAEVQVKDIMTPRRVMRTFDRALTIQAALADPVPLPFSRIPVHGDGLDDIVGVVLRHQLLEASMRGDDEATVGDVMLPIRAIPETASVSHAFDEFIRRQEHMLLVVDEYGGTEGIVTLEDAIETLLGIEIIDESDKVEDMRKFALDLWEKRKNRHTQFQSAIPTAPPPEEGKEPTKG